VPLGKIHKRIGSGSPSRLSRDSKDNDLPVSVLIWPLVWACLPLMSVLCSSTGRPLWSLARRLCSARGGEPNSSQAFSEPILHARRMIAVGCAHTVCKLNAVSSTAEKSPVLKRPYSSYNTQCISFRLLMAGGCLRNCRLCRETGRLYAGSFGLRV
jgi:hypothetical protein